MNTGDGEDDADTADTPLRISLTDSTRRSQDDDMTVLPDSIRETYKKDGFVVFPSVLNLRDVAALNDRLERILRGDYDRDQKPDKVPKKLKSVYQPPVAEAEAMAPIHNSSNGNGKKKNKKRGGKIGPLGFSGNLQNVKVLQVINCHKSDSLFRRLAVSPALGKLVAELAGWEGCRLAQDQVWAKPPGASPLVFHRDSPYFMFDNPDVVTVWLALDDMEEVLGPLEYVKGSHLWGDGRVGSANQFFQSNGGMKLVQSAAEREGISMDDIEVVSMAGLKAGGISIHDGRTWHGSGKNNSQSQPRRGLGIHFVPAQVRFTAEAAKSKLWKSYVQDVGDAAAAELPCEDFPITWQPMDATG